MAEYNTTNDYYARLDQSGGSTYAVLHATNPSSVFYEATVDWLAPEVEILAHTDADKWARIWRTVLRFNANVSAGSFSSGTMRVTFNGIPVTDLDDVSVVLCEFSGTAFNTNDADKFGSVAFSDEVSFGSAINGDDLTLTLNSAGLTYVSDNAGGDFSFGLVMSSDLAATAPTYSSNVRSHVGIFNHHDPTEAKRPLLSLTEGSAGGGVLSRRWGGDIVIPSKYANLAALLRA